MVHDSQSSDRQSQQPAGESEVRCGRWRLKSFELLRPVLLGPDRPLTLGEFLADPDPVVVSKFRALDLEGRQALVLSRIRGAPPDRRLALFGKGGYTFADAVREVEEGTPLGVRLIEAECKLVSLLLTEALRKVEEAPQANASAADAS